MSIPKVDRCLCCDEPQIAHAPSTLSPFLSERLGKAGKVIITVALRCDTCGFIFSGWRPADDEMQMLYTDYRGAAYTASRIKYEEQYQKIRAWQETTVPYMAHIESFLEPLLTFPVRILDWGGNDGMNAPFANRRTLDVYDITPAKLVPDARWVEKAEGKYNLIICSNVLEHVPDPAAVLAEVRRAMDDDTILYLEVPYEFDILNNDNPLKVMSYFHEHINIFTRLSVLALLVRSGFRVLSTQLVEGMMTDYAIVQMMFACRKERP